MEKPSRRKVSHFLINPPYQLKYVSMMILVALVLTAINSGIFYYFVRENYAILVDLSPMTEDTKLQLYQELKQILIYLGAFSLLFLGGVGALSVVLSHRTAGPLYRFKQVFEEIRDGNSGVRLHLRPKDDFRDVAQSFNEMMDKLASRE